MSVGPNLSPLASKTLNLLTHIESKDAKFLPDLVTLLNTDLRQFHAATRELTNAGLIAVERIGFDQTRQGALVRFHLHKRARKK